MSEFLEQKGVRIIFAKKRDQIGVLMMKPGTDRPDQQFKRGSRKVYAMPPIDLQNTMRETVIAIVDEEPTAAIKSKAIPQLLNHPVRVAVLGEIAVHHSCVRRCRESRSYGPVTV